MRSIISGTMLFILGCSQTPNYKINYQSPKIFDVEVAKGKIVYFCTKQSDPLEPRQFLVIYLLSDNKADLFFTRRKLEPLECKKWIKEIDEIYEESQFIRLVGLEGHFDKSEDQELMEHLNQKAPIIVESRWLFSRIVTKNGCVGHFGGECLSGFTEKSLYLDP